MPGCLLQSRTLQSPARRRPPSFTNGTVERSVDRSTSHLIGSDYASRVPELNRMWENVGMSVSPRYEMPNDRLKRNETDELGGDLLRRHSQLL